MQTLMSVNYKVKICSLIAYSSHLGISLAVAVSIVIEPPLIAVWYDSILIRATVRVSCCRLLKLYCSAREIGSVSTEPVSFSQVSVPVGCQIPFSKLIYCTCIFPSLYLHSLSFVLAGASISRAYWTQNGAPLQSACFSALSRVSRLPGHKRTGGSMRTHWNTLCQNHT